MLEATTIDLGDTKCVVSVIGGPHTDDSSVIYIPEEKVLFLGDCIYGRRYNGVYGFTTEKLFPMIDEIEKYDADYFIISHQKVYSKSQVNEFLYQLRSAGKIVGEDCSIDDITKRFTDTFDRLPSKDESFYINCFANVNKVLSKP